jgi:hypothetical protein
LILLKLALANPLMRHIRNMVSKPDQELWNFYLKDLWFLSELRRTIPSVDG